MIAISSLSLIGFGIVFSLILDDSIGFGISVVITLIFIIIFGIATPSTEQMVENNYYAMLEDRPKCIDAVNVSLGCKKDYIYWQKDSIEKQHKYDSVKIKLENLQNKIIRIENKTKPTDSVSVKTCIDGCWTQNVLNADLKKCQDECFR